MTLSDRDIKKVIRSGKLIFRPKLAPRQIGPASIDLKLGQIFKTFHISKHSLLDTRKNLPPDFMEIHRLRENEPFILHSNNFVLASTKEYIKTPPDIVLRVEGKSSLARMGVLVHTAGFVDPGFEGTLTLEISNQSSLAVALYPGMYICQVAVEYISSPAQVPYNKRKGSQYAKSKGPVAAKTKNLF